MIISCPECETGFNIPNNALGDEGRKVKCSKCTHVWHQPPISIEKETLDELLDSNVGASKNDNINVDKNLPITVKKGLMYGLAASAVVLLTFSMFLMLLNQARTSDSLAETFGLNDIEGLRFSNFSVEGEIIDNKYDFFFKGEFLNVSNKKIKIPLVTIKVLSSGGRVMNEMDITPEVTEIEPYSRVEFNPEITQVSGNANKIELSFANWPERSFE